jgi:hypothetical protein
MLNITRSSKENIRLEYETQKYHFKYRTQIKSETRNKIAGLNDFK